MIDHLIEGFMGLSAAQVVGPQSYGPPTVASSKSNTLLGRVGAPEASNHILQPSIPDGQFDGHGTLHPSPHFLR